MNIQTQFHKTQFHKTQWESPSSQNEKKKRNEV